MFRTQELHSALKTHFKLDKRRLDCLVQILIAIITVRTVNLVELAQAMVTGGKWASRYKRLQRFLKEFQGFSFECLSRFIAHYFLPSEKPWQLAMDRTN